MQGTGVWYFNAQVIPSLFVQFVRIQRVMPPVPGELEPVKSNEGQVDKSDVHPQTTVNKCDTAVASDLCDAGPVVGLLEALARNQQ